MKRFDIFVGERNTDGYHELETEVWAGGEFCYANEAQTEIDNLRTENEALKAKLELLLDFAQTVGGGSSFWDEVWEQEPAP